MILHLCLLWGKLIVDSGRIWFDSLIEAGPVPIVCLAVVATTVLYANAKAYLRARRERLRAEAAGSKGGDPDAVRGGTGGFDLAHVTLRNAHHHVPHVSPGHVVHEITDMARQDRSLWCHTLIFARAVADQNRCMMIARFN